MHLERTFTLLLLHGMSFIYPLSSSGLMCHLRPMFSYRFSVWLICPSMLLKSPTIIVLLLISSFMLVNVYLFI